MPEPGYDGFAVRSSPPARPGGREDDGPRAGTGGGAAPAAVRAQLLATEHWSLLATRSMTWAEVLGRIAAHLTMTSAGLVSLALVVQVSGFGTAFRVLSISISGVVLLLGTLTMMRVVNASEEDLGLVIGMNRLRQAYVDLDPGVADYLVTGHGDGYDAVARSYVPFGRRGASHVLASSAMFMMVVNAIVAGAVVALVGVVWAVPGLLTAVMGVAAGALYLLVTVAVVARVHRRAYPGHLDARHEERRAARGRPPAQRRG